MTWWLSTCNSIVSVISIARRIRRYGALSMRRALVGVCAEIESLKVKRPSVLDGGVDGYSEPLEIFEKDRFWAASLHICSESTHAIAGGVDESKPRLGREDVGID
jgi:hypothetical protein